MLELFCSSGLYPHVWSLCIFASINSAIAGVGIFILTLRAQGILFLLLLLMMMKITDSLTWDPNHLMDSTLLKVWFCRCKEALVPTQLSALKVVSYPLSHQVLPFRVTAENIIFSPLRIYESLLWHCINTRPWTHMSLLRWICRKLSWTRTLRALRGFGMNHRLGTTGPGQVNWTNIRLDVLWRWVLQGMRKLPSSSPGLLSFEVHCGENSQWLCGHVGNSLG